MRIEKHHGHSIVCGHIYDVRELMIGSRWMSSSGSIVTITDIDTKGDGWITYEWQERGETRRHEKMSFAFQCRYCLIVDSEPV